MHPFRILKRIALITYLSAKRLYVENYTYQASALAFITLLSLVPIIAVVLYFFSFFAAFHDLIYLAENYLYQNFIPSPSIRFYINQFVQQTQQLPAVSIIFSLLTGIMMVLTIEHAMNGIWHIRHKKRNLLVSLLSWIGLLLLPLFIGLMVFVNLSIASIFVVKYQFFIFNTVSLIMNSCMLGLIYILFVNTSISIFDGLMGGLLAAFLFELLKKLFVFYITYLTSYEFVYGALALIPIFLVWLYASWIIILFGALFIHTKNKLNGKLN